MAHGPLDFILIAFEDASFSSEVADGIRQLIDDKTIRIVDLVFVEKNQDNELRVLELGDLPDEVYGPWNAVVDDIEGLLTMEDAEAMAEELPANRSGVLALYENVWARSLSDAIINARGEVLANFRIPRSVISELEVEI